MQALLAYKRTVGDHTQVGFEVRSMTCFNGFNVTNAFGTVGNDRLDLVVDLNALGAAAAMQPRDAGNPNTPWVCIGMGWLSNIISGNYDVSRMLDSPIDYSGNREQLASMLNLEHVSKKMISPRTFGLVAGHREQTPNEILIAQALAQVSALDRDRIPHADFNRLAPCKMYAAVILNPRHQRCLYDFVGSERSSGMAVAYLQVYRNASQHILNNNIQAKLQSVSAMLFSLDPGAANTGFLFKSFIPILSQLFHAGGDSDIFSFAETPFVALQAMKYGTFSLNQYFSNPQSMLVEGRYAKGSQSLNLQQNVSRAASARSLNPENHRIKVVELYKAQQVLASSFSATSFYLGSLANQKRTVMEAFDVARAISDNPAQAGVECRTILTGFVDLRVPVVPVVAATARSVGAAAGFQVWVAQNDNLAV